LHWLQHWYYYQLFIDNSDERMMSKSIIATDKAPAAIGPYVQATKLGDLVFTSGQIPLIPETMQLVTGNIKIQAEQVLTNLSAILDAAGASRPVFLKT
jgi:2-iminobutanoate/2-iminopropanoate deaminase